jgi:hypothetical protein
VRLQFENIRDTPVDRALLNRQIQYSFQTLAGFAPVARNEADDGLARYENGMLGTPRARQQAVQLLRAALERDCHNERAIRVMQHFNRDLLEVDVNGDPVENRETMTLIPELFGLWMEENEDDDVQQWQTDIRDLNRWYLRIDRRGRSTSEKSTQDLDFSLLGRAEESLSDAEITERRQMEEYLDRELLGLQGADDEIGVPGPNLEARQRESRSSHGNTTITAHRSERGPTNLPSSPPGLRPGTQTPPEVLDDVDTCNRPKPARSYDCTHSQIYIDRAVEAARAAFLDELDDFFDGEDGPNFRTRLVNDIVRELGETLLERYPPRPDSNADTEDDDEEGGGFDAEAFAGGAEIVDVSSGENEVSAEGRRSSPRVKSEVSSPRRSTPGSRHPTPSRESTRDPDTRSLSRRNSPMVVIPFPESRQTPAPSQRRPVTRSQAAIPSSSPIRNEDTPPLQPKDEDEDDECAITECPNTGDLGDLKECSGGCGKEAHGECIKRIYGNRRKRTWTCRDCEKAAREKSAGAGKRRRGKTVDNAVKQESNGREKRQKSVEGEHKALSERRSVKRKSSEVEEEEEVDENETIAQRRKRTRKPRFL